MINLLYIFIVVLLVFFNAFFVATEFSMVKVRKSKIETLINEGNKSARHTLTVINNLNSYLSACQLGITLASLGLGWVGEPAIAMMLEPLFELFELPASMVHSISFILGFSIITTIHIVLGELVPKSLAIIKAEKIAMKTALPLIMFFKITNPIMWLFNNSTNAILKIFGISQVDEHDVAHTDEEIKLLVAESYQHGLIDQTELALVDNIFDFSETTVKDIMVPRTDMICIFLEDSIDEILATTFEKHLTRYPVCRESKDNVIGFLHVKDLFQQKILGNIENIEDLIRKPHFVPESLSISELLKIFKTEKIQMAIIVDEYGGTAGLATLEDILEEIVGEMQDEFDEESDEIVVDENGDYIVNGKVRIDEITDLIDADIEAENIDTIGGWVYSQLEGYPQINDQFIFEDYEFTVLNCDEKRVIKVRIKKI